MADPRLTVIIVNWNTRELLRDCLSSLGTGDPDVPREIMVVDNASRDGSPEMVAREFPAVRLIANTENVGFARANNQAIRASRGPRASRSRKRRSSAARSTRSWRRPTHCRRIRRSSTTSARSARKS